MILWEKCLQTIIDHGGWTNINDEQVKLEEQRRRTEAIQRRKDQRKARAHDLKAARLQARAITQDFLNQLQAERDRRAAHLKSLRGVVGRSKQDVLWLTSLPDVTCERVADVWRSRELLSYMRRRATGPAIAMALLSQGQSQLKLSSLTTRVYKDLERIAKLEDDRAGSAMWSRWRPS